MFFKLLSINLVCYKSSNTFFTYLLKMKVKILLVLLMARQANLMKSYWMVKRIDVFEREFSIFVAEAEPERTQLLIAINNSMTVELVDMPSDYYTAELRYERGSGQIGVGIKYHKSIEGGIIKFKLASTSLVMTSTETRDMTPQYQPMKFHSHFIEDGTTATARYTSIALKAISILGGTVMMVNSILKLNGLLLLKFAQMLDFINFIGFINVNFRESILDTLTQIYQISKANFLFIPVPLDFANVKQKYAQSRGRLTELKVSPVLLENQLPETIFLIGTYLLKLLFSRLRKRKWLGKLSNVTASIHFSIVQLVVIEQFFYASYQLNSRYNYETFIWENFVSLACSIISIAIIVESLCEAAVVVNYGKMIADKSECSKKPDEPYTLSFCKLSHPSYIIEFVQADIDTKKLSMMIARIYNLLFVLRFITIDLALSMCQPYPLLQVTIIASSSLAFLVMTVLAAFKYGIFASKWVACQRLVQEILIFGIFGILLAMAIDEHVPFASLDIVGKLSLAFVCLMAISLIIEVVFFLINFVKSVILAIAAIYRWCTRKKRDVKSKNRLCPPMKLSDESKDSGKKTPYSQFGVLLSTEHPRGKGPVKMSSNLNKVNVKKMKMVKVGVTYTGDNISNEIQSEANQSETPTPSNIQKSNQKKENIIKVDGSRSNGPASIELEGYRKANHAKLINLHKDGFI